MIKLRRKSVDLSQKSFFGTSKLPFAIHFFLAGCNVCPVAIAEILTQTQVSGYWQLIHYAFPRFSSTTLIDLLICILRYSPNIRLTHLLDNLIDNNEVLVLSKNDLYHVLCGPEISRIKLKILSEDYLFFHF